MKNLIQSTFKTSAELKEEIASSPELLNSIERAARMLIDTAKRGGTISSCGNGGSACDAMHLHEELVARYQKERPGIKSRHFLDAAVISCWSNDYDYTSVFERQVETLCEPHDLLVLISTSGNSENVIRAAKAAQKKGVETLGLLGRDGGQLIKLCDCSVTIPSNVTARIQEVHSTLIHIFCELMERELF